MADDSFSIANDPNNPQVSRTLGDTSNSSSSKHIYTPSNLTLCSRTSRSRVSLRNGQVQASFHRHLIPILATHEISVLKTFEKELAADGLNALKLLERARVMEGEAMPDEVTQVVTNRNGAILSASTILKSDFFSNLQKMSLPEYVRTKAHTVHRYLTSGLLT